MATRARSAAEPTVWALTAEAIEQWIGKARAGEEIVYARAPRLPLSDGVQALQRLHDQGLVTFKQRRNGPDDYSYIAERLAAPKRPSAANRLVRPVPGPDDDDVAMLMAVLRRLAVGNKPCPTNRELGEMIGDAGPDRVAYLLRKQISAGRITVEASGIGRRVVTIVATGRRTAP